MQLKYHSLYNVKSGHYTKEKKKDALQDILAFHIYVCLHVSLRHYKCKLLSGPKQCQSALSCLPYNAIVITAFDRLISIPTMKTLSQYYIVNYTCMFNMHQPFQRPSLTLQTLLLFSMCTAVIITGDLIYDAC